MYGNRLGRVCSCVLFPRSWLLNRRPCNCSPMIQRKYPKTLNVRATIHILTTFGRSPLLWSLTRSDFFPHTIFHRSWWEAGSQFTARSLDTRARDAIGDQATGIGDLGDVMGDKFVITGGILGLFRGWADRTGRSVPSRDVRLGSRPHSQWCHHNAAEAIGGPGETRQQQLPLVSLRSYVECGPPQLLF